MRRGKGYWGCRGIEEKRKGIREDGNRGKETGKYIIYNSMCMYNNI
jgi:hypothetical protein